MLLGAAPRAEGAHGYNCAMNIDVVVVGAGLVGTSFARAARGLSLALVGHAPAGAAAAPAGIFDSRVYALTPANVALLRALKVWQAMPAERLTPVHAMRVYGDDETSMLEFDAYEAGAPELAWIVEDAPLRNARLALVLGVQQVVRNGLTLLGVSAPESM